MTPLTHRNNNVKVTTPHFREIGRPLKCNARPLNNFTLLNTHREQIQREVFNTHDIPPPSAPMSETMGRDHRRWCKYHKVKSHHTKDCYQLKKKINRLNQEVHLKKYA